LNRSDGGADSAFSMEPEEFASLVREGSSAAAALGDARWSMQPSESESRRLRRSLYIVKAVQAGDIISSQNVRSIRPSGGCPPKFLEELLGKSFKFDLAAGTPLTLDLVDT
jgi:sialic acid synthase SpsE